MSETKPAPQLKPAGPTRRSRVVRGLTAAVCGLLVGGGVLWCFNPELVTRSLSRADLNTYSVARFGPSVWARPYGMAPQAFKEFLAACREMNISPNRIGQTIGNHPRSVGYHKRDGVLKVGGERIDYTAAVDLSVTDLNDVQIAQFCRLLGKHGFAAWYRHGPRWRNGEHVHAVWGSLPMKQELRGQVTDWLRERRLAGGKAYGWERKVRREWGLRGG